MQKKDWKMEIRSKEAIVTFRNLGAEIMSFKKSDADIEHMWQGDPKYWQGRNPILFPIVGNTYSKDYMIDGVVYAMGNHGLTRHMDFEVVSESSDSITFMTKSNSDTLKQYPFEFKMLVEYSLQGTKLTIKYTIENTGDKVMPFTFGLHPGFNVPLASGKFSDYSLVFEKEENPIQLVLDDKVEVAAFKEIKLDYEVFNKYKTLVYENLVSDYVQLTNGKEGLEVGIAGYPYLAFWCGESAPFLCIEPWYGLGDVKENDCKFEDRIGMKSLPLNGSFETEYYIKLL